MGFFSSAEEKARRKKEKKQIQEKAMSLPATTADLKQEYSIIGILQAESLILLREQAVKKGADALVGVGYFGYDTQCYGTAVKFLDLIEQNVIEPETMIAAATDLEIEPEAQEDLAASSPEEDIENSL